MVLNFVVQLVVSFGGAPLTNVVVLVVHGVEEVAFVVQLVDLLDVEQLEVFAGVDVEQLVVLIGVDVEQLVGLVE